jgi:transcriptional regulator with XRE-family HTH domain
MVNQKFFLKDNLRFLRERQKKTQDDLAAVLNISRSKLNALENGQTKNPQMEDLTKCSEYFKVSIDSLIKIDLAKLGELKLRELVLAISVDQNNKENIEYVPKKAQAGYVAGYNDPEFIGALPKFYIPNLPSNATYRMFPTEGRSMMPYPEGCDVVTTYVSDWTELANDSDCIVVLKSGQFLFKAVDKRIEENRTILLRSLNPEFQDQEVPVSEILEIWKYYGHWTKERPEMESDVIKEVKEIKALLQQQTKA